MLGHPFQHQTRCVGCHQALETHPNLFAASQVSAGKGVGVAQVFGGAVKHDVATALTRPRPHVDHAIGRQHHRRVMLHHHQRIAGIAQTLHGADNALHVARMQADARFVQHKQRVDEGGSQCGGQVDALHLAATERSALAVQGQVANADVAEVFQSGADFFEQEFQGFCFCLRSGWDTGCGGLLMVRAQIVTRHTQCPSLAARSIALRSRHGIEISGVGRGRRGIGSWGGSRFVLAP